jgi:hypothetical protein
MSFIYYLILQRSILQGILFVGTNGMKSLPSLETYCVQPFVSETTRCSSNDFITINDDTQEFTVRFMPNRKEGKES